MDKQLIQLIFLENDEEYEIKNRFTYIEITIICKKIVN